MPLPAVIPLVASLVSILAKASAANKGAKHTKAQEKFAEAERKKNERASRRNALLRAVGAKTIVAPTLPGQAPSAPNLTAEAIISGIGDVAGQSSVGKIGSPAKKAALEIKKKALEKRVLQSGIDTPDFLGQGVA